MARAVGVRGGRCKGVWRLGFLFPRPPFGGCVGGSSSGSQLGVLSVLSRDVAAALVIPPRV